MMDSKDEAKVGLVLSRKLYFLSGYFMEVYKVVGGDIYFYF